MGDGHCPLPTGLAPLSPRPPAEQDLAGGLSSEARRHRAQNCLAPRAPAPPELGEGQRVCGQETPARATLSPAAVWCNP